MSVATGPTWMTPRRWVGTTNTPVAARPAANAGQVEADAPLPTGSSRTSGNSGSPGGVGHLELTGDGLPDRDPGRLGRHRAPAGWCEPIMNTLPPTATRPGAGDHGQLLPASNRQASTQAIAAAAGRRVRRA